MISSARIKLLSAALRAMSSDYEDNPHSNSDAEAEYATEQLALAAQELVRAIDEQPANYPRPVGWVR
jgi:hypothetical protein